MNLFRTTKVRYYIISYHYNAIRVNFSMVVIPYPLIDSRLFMCDRSFGL